MKIWELGGTSGQDKELCRGLLVLARGQGSDTLGNGIRTQNYTKRWGLWGLGGDSKEQSNVWGGKLIRTLERS